jgi:drug/metabolite transporter (DMT)-like permease
VEVIAAVSALGALGTGIAFAINLRNIRLIGASAASTVTYLIPVFAVLIGVSVLDEHLAWNQPVGALIILIGVAVSQGPLVDRLTRRRVDPAQARETVPTA